MLKCLVNDRLNEIRLIGLMSVLFYFCAGVCQVENGTVNNFQGL